MAAKPFLPIVRFLRDFFVRESRRALKFRFCSDCAIFTLKFQRAVPRE
jgi:hypothetical protein